MKESGPDKNESQLSLEDEMKIAAQDPRFLADIEEIMEDFKYVDCEHFGEDEDA